MIYKIVTEVTNRLLTNKGLSTMSEDYMDWHYPPRPTAEQWRRPTKAQRKRRKKAKAAPEQAEQPNEAAPPEDMQPPEEPPSTQDAPE